MKYNTEVLEITEVWLREESKFFGVGQFWDLDVKEKVQEEDH